MTTRNLKEVGGKSLAPRTGTLYKAGSQEVRLPGKTKPDSYPDWLNVNQGSIRRKDYVLNGGGLGGEPQGKQ